MGKVSKIIMSFNGGELSPLMDSRIDQVKYASGCRTLENFVPLIYGGAQERPGLEFINSVKDSSAKTLLLPFEHSVDDTYILEFGNQYIRFYKNGARLSAGNGTESLTPLGNIVAHWLLNDTFGTTVLDDDGETHNGTATADATALNVAGKVGTGCFDFDGQYAVTVASHNDFSFDDSGSNPFSIACWGYVTQNGLVQVLVSKWDETTGAEDREWRLALTHDRKLMFHLSDDSINLTGDMIGQWKLNDDLGDTVVVDTAGTQNGVASQNTSSFTTTGKIGKAFNFDGTNDYVRIADNAAYDFTGAFSIAVWVKASVLETNWVVSRYDASSTHGYHINMNLNDRWEFWIDRDGVADSVWSDEGVIIGAWTFIVVTRDGSGNMKMYINNVLQTDTGTLSGAISSNSKLHIGERWNENTSERWNGDIDNVVLFNIALTQANVTNLYNSGVGTESLAATLPNAISNDAVAVGWHFFCVTYNSAGGSAAADGIILYVDSVAVSSTKTNETGYVAMENTDALVRIGAQESTGGSNEAFWADKMDEVSIFSDVLTSDEIVTLYNLTPYEITTPYLTADLFELKVEQSADVMYITHPSYEPRKLSRLGDTNWFLNELDLRTGPFRDQNTDTAVTIVSSGTTGSVILTAVGADIFTSDHEPSGSSLTSKSLTGTLFKLVQAVSGANQNISFDLDTTNLNAVTPTITIYKGITWDFTTNGTWGQTGDSATVVLERSYDSGTTYETVHTITSAANKNVSTSGTEETADAIYRVRVSEANASSAKCEIQLSVRNTSHIGIVEITSVTNSKIAVATVLKTLASTDLTHRWSEGSLSNRRGWPIDVTISSEERLTLAGNVSEPLTKWGSVIGDFTDFKLGSDDDDALNLTLVGSGQQNRIRWILSKNVLVIGTVGGEHLLGASSEEEALTPTNVKAKLQTTYGSADIAALIVNQAVIFVQRGGRKIREFLYEFETNSYKADDLTVFAEHITESGIVSMVFQRTPDPMLWCIREDGELAIMTYERDQNVFSWARFITQTNLAGTKSDSDFESVAIIYGGAGNEDEVWVTVERTIQGSPVRYVERFFQRKMPSAIADMKYLDSYVTYTGGTTTATGLGHLKGQTVQVLGDGVVQSEASSGDFVVTADGEITLPSTFTKVQIGLGYTATVKPMKIDLNGLGLTVTKKINRGVFSVFETIGGKVGTSTSRLHDIDTGTSALFTDSVEIPLSGGYSRAGDIIAQQSEPLPLTVLAFSLDIGASKD